jgi:hypothetical protein
MDTYPAVEALRALHTENMRLYNEEVTRTQGPSSKLRLLYSAKDASYMELCKAEELVARFETEYRVMVKDPLYQHYAPIAEVRTGQTSTMTKYVTQQLKAWGYYP